MGKSDVNVNEIKHLLKQQCGEPSSLQNFKHHDAPIVSVEQIKQSILQNNYDDNDDFVSAKLNDTDNKTQGSLALKLAEQFDQNEEEREITLIKAPKRLLRLDLVNDEEVPLKTLEDLKIEQQNKNWAWKEKGIEELQNYLSDNDKLVPDEISCQQTSLKHLNEELDVVEKFVENKNTSIIVQLREEKEREFEHFMSGVKKYIEEGTTNKEEQAFKQGVQSYLDLIDDAPKSNFDSESSTNIN